MAVRQQTIDIDSSWYQSKLQHQYWRALPTIIGLHVLVVRHGVEVDLVGRVLKRIRHIKSDELERSPGGKQGVGTLLP